MPSKELLIKMGASEVWRSAVSEGLYAARKISAYGENKNAVSEWFQKHPEYADSDVKALLDTGEKQEFQQLLQDASDNGLTVVNGSDIYLPKK